MSKVWPYELVLQCRLLTDWSVSGEPVHSDFLCPHCVDRSAGKSMKSRGRVGLDSSQFCSGWVCRKSNSPVLLTTLII